MEQVTYGVKLNQDVSGPAKQAADALNKMDAAARKAQGAMQNKFAAQWEKIGLAASKAAFKQEQAFAKSWEKIGLAAEKSQRRQQQSFANSWSKIGMEMAKAQQRAHEKAKEHSFLSGIKEGVGFDKFTKASFFGTLAAESVMEIGKGMVEAAHKVVEIITEGFSKGLEEGGKLETLRLGYRLSLGKQGGRESLEDIDRFSRKTGFDDDEIAKLLLPLRRAGFSQKAARTSFAMAGDLAAGNGRGGDIGFIGGLLDTFTNIKLKGGVTRKQLAGMGVDTVSFYRELGRKLKISEKAAEEKAEAGKGTDPQLILNTIGDAIEKQQGGKLGTGTEAYGKTMEGRLHRLQQLPNDYLKMMADSPMWNRLSEKLGGILETLAPDSPRGQKIIGGLMAAFDKIVDSIDRILTPENITAFADGLDKAVRLAGALASAIMPVINGILRLTEAYNFGDKVRELGGGDSNKGVTELLKSGLPSKSAMEAQDDAWKKVREAQGIGWWDNLNMSPADKNEAIAKAEREGKVSPAVASAARIPVSQTNNINVTVNGLAAKDATHTGQQLAEQIGKHVTNQFERAAQEGG